MIPAISSITAHSQEQATRVPVAPPEPPVSSHVAPIEPEPAVTVELSREAKFETTPPPEQATEELNEAARRFVEELREKVRLRNTGLNFSIDDDGGNIVITVVDSDTNEIIRRIPPEEFGGHLKNFTEPQGLLLSSVA